MPGTTTPGPLVGLRDVDPNAFNISAARDQQDRAELAERQRFDWRPIALGGALVWIGLRRRSLPGFILGAGGSGLALAGLMGKVWLRGPLAPEGETSVRIEESITIDRPLEQVYRDWHDIENLPRILSNVISVRDHGDGRSRWVVAGPLGRTVTWEAEAINDDANRVLSWRSVGKTAAPNVGAVHFHATPDARGSEVRVRIEYDPPGGPAGAAVARLLGSAASEQVASDLRRFKVHVEASTPAET